MNREKIYNQWCDKAKHVEISSGFANEVMSKVQLYEQTKNKPWFDWNSLLDRITTHKAAKAAFIAIGATAGLLRVLFAAYALLRC